MNPAGPTFELGELTHEPEAGRGAGPEPVRSRLRRIRRPSWPGVLAAALVLTIAVVAGWHAGAGRAASRQTALTKSHPPALAWLTFVASSGEYGTADSHTVLDLNLVNLGSSDLRVVDVVSHTQAGAAQALLRTNRSVVAEPGETSHRIIDVRSACRSPFVDASLEIDLEFLGPGRTTTSTRITPVDDGTVGIPYADILRVLCARPDQPSEGGLSGIFIQQTSSADSARMVLTNRAAQTRRVEFVVLEPDGFVLRTRPGPPLLVLPGASVSVLLTVRVRSCAQVGRLSNWADGVSLRVTPVGNGAADSTGPATTGLRDVLLAPAGAAVAKAC